MHAMALAKELQIKKVLIPVATAVFSAWGMLMTDLRHDLIQTNIRRTDEVSIEELDGIWGDMEKQAVEYFQREKMDAEDMVFTRYADMRYLGQEHTVKVPVPAGKMDASVIRDVEQRFHSLHEHNYTFRLDDSLIEFVNFHLTTFGTVKKPEFGRLENRNSDPSAAIKGYRDVDFDEEGWQRSAIYGRDLLGAGAVFDGPAVIEEPASSTVVFPGQTVTVDDYGNLIIETGV